MRTAPSRKSPRARSSLTAGQTQQHSLSFTVPEGVRAEAVAALDFVVASPEGSPTPGGGFFLTLLRSSSDAGIGSGESRFGAASDLVVVPSLPGTAEAGVVAPDDGAGFAVATLPRGSLTVRLAARVALDPVPVATTASAGAREGDALELLVNGTAVDAVVASVEPVLPGLVGGAGALADLRAVSYALLATEAGPAVPLEHWVSGPDPVPLAASLRAAAPPGSSIATAAVDPLGAPLAPLAWLLLVPCLLAAAGVLLPATPPVARTARAAEDPGPDGAPDPTVGAGLSGAAVAVGGVVLGLAAGAVAAVTAVAGGGSAPSPTPSLDPGLLAATLLGSLGLVAFAFFRRGRAGTTPGGRIHGEGAGGVPSPVSAVVARTGG
ncbi:hypothetical protein [Arthrobacter agilis]|uniref:hypothetical protein n=1 Tax=Arthrobacter agilis TaxID=37921 RepID=UPI0027838B74|nr:hypothetical protein [Arthrobacter agilis]MDQ0735769.1 hypothetical protein [Arthrobacter agilis]